FDITAVAVLRPVEQLNGSVMVNWTTSSESNTSAFKIMRGLSATGPWIQVGATMPPLGGSLVGKSYVLEDSTTSPSVTYYYLLQVIADDGSVQQSIGPVRLNTNAPTATPRPTSTTRPTSTHIPTRTPTIFRTATNSFRTSTPTMQTSTSQPVETDLMANTPTLEPFQKPTNLQSTETKRPTLISGALLDKEERQPGNRNVFLLVVGGTIIVGIVVLYLYLTRKTH
ncbi:MAG: hypothetical protein GX768_04820, partial [Chloroflexi bacterium]|nr:hypothetical protein [Chloroflexota bacterium]